MTAQAGEYTDFAIQVPGRRRAATCERTGSRCLVRDLPAGRAVPLRVMSEDFTLYRGQGGRPHVVGFRCAHRGTQLSTGWVEDDAIRCFYHGWKYDHTGQCIEQPGEDEAFARKIRIDRYPTRQYLGLIFACLGEGLAPDLPHYKAEAARRRASRPKEPYYPLAQRIMRGETGWEEANGRADIVGIQDYVSQVGQGIVADREHERLGKSDAGIITLRKLWSAELRALAEGGPMRRWERREHVHPVAGAV